MFLGHYGLAFGVKRAVPRASLGTLTFAAQFLDELWPILLLLGVEQVRIQPGLMAASALDFVSYPISHSLVMAVVWGALIGGVYHRLRRDRRTALVIGGLVVSHWLLDAPMHGPDLPLWPGSSTRVGLGIWYSLPVTLMIELGLFGGGVFLYLRGTRARDRTGKWAPWTLIVTLLGVYLPSLSGAPPPSVRALAVTTLFLWLFIPWAAWIDRHREPVGMR